MRNVLAIGLAIIGLVGALWLGIWWGVIQPIIIITDAIDAGNVTAGLVGGEAIKFLFKELLAYLWVALFFGLAGATADA